MFTLLAIGWGIGRGEDPAKKNAPPDNSKEAIMRRKLVQAQKLLERLALSDFAKIQSACDELAILRQKAAWMAFKTRDYEVNTNDFQRQIEAIQKAAKDKNIDAATLAYVDMTLTCVRCHKYVREQGIGLAPSLTRDRQLVRRDR